MKLTLRAKKIDIRTGDRFVAVLHKDTAHRLNLFVGDRIHIKKGRTELTAIVEITDDILKKDMIGLYCELYAQLKAGRGDKVHVRLAERPASLEHIKSKLKGKRLDRKKIDELVKDIVSEDLSDTELAYFISAVSVHGLNDLETLEFTKSIAEHGNHLKFKQRIVMDKHSIGGVPGNRVSLIIVPIITAMGFKMPKTTSRAISSPSGTADTFETLCNVTHDVKSLKKIAEKVDGFVSWGGAVDLASADDELIGVRNNLEMDPEGILLSSIMAKKLAAGSNTLVIDLPYGRGCKFGKAGAKKLKNRFTKLSKALKISVQVHLSDGSQPIGNGIGPVLEALDVIKVLKNEKDAPRDLREKALKLAGILIDMSGRFWWKRGITVARKMLESGKAYDQFQKIISAQGARKKALRPGSFTHDVFASKTSTIGKIENSEVTELARIAGSPKDASAGIYFHKKVGQKVKRRQKLFTIYAGDKERLEFAKTYLAEHKVVYLDKNG